MIPERHAKVEPVVNSVFVHLAQVVINTARAQHRAGDAGVDRECPRQHAYTLRARHKNLIRGEQILELVQKPWVVFHHFPGFIQPSFGQVHPASAEPHIIAHHPGAGQRLKKVEDLFAFAKGVHQRRAQRPHVHEQEPGKAGMVLQSRQLRRNNADVFGSLGWLEPGELLDCEGVSQVAC